MSFANFAFQQVGGRWKIVVDDDIVYCTAEQVAKSHNLQTMKKAKADNKMRLHRASVLNAKSQVNTFLKKHGFRADGGVNAAKLSLLGFRCTYPLHQAAQEKDWHMVCLLLYFGANSLQRDSRGRTVFSYMDGHDVPEEVRKFLGQPQGPLPAFLNI
mmetsp:Transcript_51841/g.120941  ORF Transcript_51841/g.120941 Transcript_51841/m.120941 type:complete len:157 (-) Transcript_51841:37-507(-)